MKRSFPASLLLIVLCAWLVLLSEPGASRPRPRLIVLMVIDQLGAASLEKFDPLLRGGLRRMLDQGAVYTAAAFRHAMTLTSPGHAAIGTGLHPSSNGITANYRYDPRRKERITSVSDPGERAIGGPGASSSPRSLMAATLGDWLKKADPESQVVGVALKDRSAMLLTGRNADAAYWLSTDCGCLVTSSYYMKEPPAWLTLFNQTKFSDQYAGKTWTRLRRDTEIRKHAENRDGEDTRDGADRRGNAGMGSDVKIYETYARQDAFEGENFGQRNTFPHRLRSKPPDRKFYADLFDSGFSDEVLLQAVLAAIEGHRLGADESTDLLAVSFAGVDRVGHVYGPFSQETLDTVLRLDQVLESFLRELDRRVGLDRVVIGLTADHGVLPLVEHLQLQGAPAKRFPKTLLPDAVNRAVNERYPGAGKVVAYFDSPNIFFDLARLEERNIPRAAAEELGRQALLETGYVEQVYLHSDLAGLAPSNDPYWPLYRNSFYRPRSQHLIVRIKKYHYVNHSQGSTGHGSVYDYDRRVPLLLFGAGIGPGRYDRPAGPEDLAPTLGKLAGLEMPLEPDTGLLYEVLR